MSGVGKKLEVESFDETCYLPITIARTNAIGSFRMVDNSKLDNLESATVADALAMIPGTRSIPIEMPKSTNLDPQPISVKIAEKNTKIDQETEPSPTSKPIAQSVLESNLKSEPQFDPPLASEQKSTGKKLIPEIIAPKRTRHIFKKFCSGLSTVAVALVALSAIALVGMRLAGFRTFTIMSGSMSPDYPVGALIYVQPVDYKSLKIGDVISYVANDDNTVVTHRVVEIIPDENDPNTIRFKTKGDANASADARLVHYKNVLGTPIITFPLIGYFAHNIQQPPGIYIALVVGTLLLAWTFLPSTLEERRKTARTSVT